MISGLPLCSSNELCYCLFATLFVTSTCPVRGGVDIMPVIVRDGSVGPVSRY